MEEFCEPTSEIFSNLHNIQLRLKFPNNYKKFDRNFALLKSNFVGPFFAKGIEVPKFLKVKNKDQLLFNLFSSRIKIKSILSIKVRFSLTNV